METLHCIHARRSIRKYLDIPLEMEKYGKVIEAGFQAPTAGNVQDVRYIMVTDGSTRKKLAEASLQQYWMESAPVHVVVCIDIKRGKQFYGVRGERLYAPQHAGAAVMNMLLTAQDIGIGACWVGAFDEEMVKDICGIPDYARPHAIVTLGYSDETPPKPPKILMESYTFIERYNNKIKNFPAAITEWSPCVEEGVKTGIQVVNQAGNSIIDKIVLWFKKIYNEITKKKE